MARLPAGFVAAAGTAIGAITHHPLLGAAIGGLGGAATGAVVGNAVDKDEQHQQAAAVAQAQAQAAQAQAMQARVGIADIIAMTRDKLDDTVIINQIRVSRSTFQLTPTDLIMLKDNGVSDRVIAEMQARSGPPGVIVQQRRRCRLRHFVGSSGLPRAPVLLRSAVRLLLRRLLPLMVSAAPLV